MFIDASNVIEHKYCSNIFAPSPSPLPRSSMRMTIARLRVFTFERNNTKSEAQLICRILCEGERARERVEQSNPREG